MMVDRAVIKGGTASRMLVRTINTSVSISKVQLYTKNNGSDNLNRMSDPFICVCRHGIAKGRRCNSILGDALIEQELLGSHRPLIAEYFVVLLGTQVVGVTSNLDSNVGILFHDVRNSNKGGEKFGFEIGFVEVKIDRFSP